MLLIVDIVAVQRLTLDNGKIVIDPCRRSENTRPSVKTNQPLPVTGDVPFALHLFSSFVSPLAHASAVHSQ